MYSHLSSLDNLMVAYTRPKHVVAYYILLLIIYNCCVLWLYVCIEIYTLQLYIIDLTQQGCHTLRHLKNNVVVSLFGMDVQLSSSSLE